MAYLSWLEAERDLTNAALTVRAQARSAIDLGTLYHPALFPRVDAPSVRLADIFTLDFRPTADRREWNTRGRQIHLKNPALREVEMLPIESYFKVEEYEMQKILEGASGNQAVFRSIVAPSIPARTDTLVGANLRRLEVDAHAAWANGEVVVRNPQGSGANQTISLGFSNSRYVTPAAWTGGSAGTAYAQFIEETYNAQTLIGTTIGAVMRLSTFRAIQQSAGPAVGTGQVSPLSRSVLQDRIAGEFGGPFTFVVIEDTVDVYDDGGTAFTNTKLWPANKVAWIPASGIIGSTFYAPVARAYDIAANNPGAQIDVRGQTVVREVANNGRELTVECQVNALALPNEQAVYVVNAGI